MRYSKVPRALWHEGWFRAASPPVRELALYLLTGPRSLAIPGLTLARPGVVADDLAWSSRRLNMALTALLAAGWVEVDAAAGLMFVPSALVADGVAVEFNKAVSRNAAKAWINALGDLQPGNALIRIIDVMEAHATGIGDENANEIRRGLVMARARLGLATTEGNPIQRPETEQRPEGEQRPAAVAASPSAIDRAPEVEPTSKPTPTRRRATQLPPDFAPTDAHRAFCAKHDLDLDIEAERFRLHHGDTGKAHRNWDLTFSKWLLNPVAWKARDGHRTSSTAQRAARAPTIREITDEELTR